MRYARISKLISQTHGSRAYPSITTGCADTISCPTIDSWELLAVLADNLEVALSMRWKYGIMHDDQIHNLEGPQGRPTWVCAEAMFPW